ERALADSGIAANQNQRTGNDAATEHAIEFGHSGRHACLILRLNFRVGDRSHFAEFEAAAIATLFRISRPFFDERIPLATLGTFSQPLARLVTAVLTGKYGFRV